MKCCNNCLESQYHLSHLNEGWGVILNAKLIQEGAQDKGGTAQVVTRDPACEKELHMMR
jgi:hypothetical protein